MWRYPSQPLCCCIWDWQDTYNHFVATCWLWLWGLQVVIILSFAPATCHYPMSHAPLLSHLWPVTLPSMPCLHGVWLSISMWHGSMAGRQASQQLLCGQDLLRTTVPATPACHHAQLPATFASQFLVLPPYTMPSPPTAAIIFKASRQTASSLQWTYYYYYLPLGQDRHGLEAGHPSLLPHCASCTCLCLSSSILLLLLKSSDPVYSHACACHAMPFAGSFCLTGWPDFACLPAHAWFSISDLLLLLSHPPRFRHTHTHRPSHLLPWQWPLFSSSTKAHHTLHFCAFLCLVAFDHAGWVLQVALHTCMQCLHAACRTQHNHGSLHCHKTYHIHKLTKIIRSCHACMPIVFCPFWLPAWVPVYMLHLHLHACMCCAHGVGCIQSSQSNHLSHFGSVTMLPTPLLSLACLSFLSTV